MSDAREGGCQCGRVRYWVVGEPIGVGVCHCQECQRQSGSAFGMSFIIPKDAFRLSQGELKFFSRVSDSGRPVLCAFCPECGTRIYHEARWLEGTLNVKPGTFDDTSFLRPTGESFAARKHPWVELRSISHSFEGQPPSRP